MASSHDVDRPCASNLNHHLSRNAEHHQLKEYEAVYWSRAQKCLRNPNAYQLAASTLSDSLSIFESKCPLPQDQTRLQSSICRLSFEYLHPNIPYANPDVAVQYDKKSSLCAIFRLLCNDWFESRDWQGDRPGLLVEAYTHSWVITLGKSLGINIVPIGMDAEGTMSSGAGGLEDILRNWKKTEGRRPHLMYTIPIAQIPTGRILSTGRKKDIYSICHEYDIIIIEDGQYWHLQYPHGSLQLNFRSPKIRPPIIEYSIGGKTNSPVASYLAFDLDGRVIRLDSSLGAFSASHERTSIIAQADCIQCLRQMSGSSLHTSFEHRRVTRYDRDTPQDMLRFKEWVEKLERYRKSYEERMNNVITALDLSKYTVTVPTRTKVGSLDCSGWLNLDKVQMYSFSRPDAGIMIWLRVHFSSHPLAPKISGLTLSRALWMLWTSDKYSVLLLPGELHEASRGIAEKDGWQFFGLSIADMPAERCYSACKTLTEGLREFWEMDDETCLPAV